MKTVNALFKLKEKKWKSDLQVFIEIIDNEM